MLETCGDGCNFLQLLTRDECEIVPVQEARKNTFHFNDCNLLPNAIGRTVSKGKVSAWFGRVFPSVRIKSERIRPVPRIAMDRPNVQNELCLFKMSVFLQAEMYTRRKSMSENMYFFLRNFSEYSDCWIQAKRFFDDTIKILA